MSKFIELHSKKGITGQAIVDNEDYEYINQFKWSLHPRGYARNNKGMMMHRLILSTPNHLEVDHINHNKLDNRRSNIKNVTHAKNMTNRLIHKNNKTGVKGVQFFRNKYRVFVGKDYVGVFKTLDEAKEAYTIAFKSKYDS